MAEMKQEWFELTDLRRRRFADSVWIPLRASFTQKRGAYGQLGYTSTFTGICSLAVPLSMRKRAPLDWNDIGLIHDQRPYATQHSYKPADVYEWNQGEYLGTELVLVQGFDGAEPRCWHLHQDLVIALGLLRDGGRWVCPEEAYTEVARIHQDANSSPTRIEIKAEYLRDYLAARQMALRIVSYQNREAVMDDVSCITWAKQGLSEEAPDERFQTRTWAIHEGGEPYGSKAAVFHISRTDVDFEADVPILGDPTNENTTGESWELECAARKLYIAEGELWRNEWLEPATYSPRVRGDEVPSQCSFIIDASGTRKSSDELDHEDIGRWLWFRPGVVTDLLGIRGSTFKWYTRQTAGIEATRGYHVHLGLNDLGLITTYAYDVARLPEWQRRIWAGFNVSPEGGVSRELLKAHVEGRVANSKAPERCLVEAWHGLDEKFEARYGFRLFRKHEITEKLLAAVNRFRSIDKLSLLALAKDLARLTSDSIDVAVLHKIAPPPVHGQAAGSLKSLERVLTTLASPDRARLLLRPLFGVYELRLGDAHLPSSKADDAFELVGLDRETTWLQQGERLIEVIAEALNQIGNECAISVNDRREN